MHDYAARLRTLAKNATYPLPPVEQPGYLFEGKCVAIDSATLEKAADVIDGLQARILELESQK